MNYFVLLNEGEYAQAFEAKPEAGEMDSIYEDFRSFISDSYIDPPKPPPCPEGQDEDEWEEKYEEIWDNLSLEEQYASLLDELKKGEKVKLYRWFDNHPFTWPS